MRKPPTLQALARLVRFANAYSVQLLALLLTQGCSNPWARIRKRLRRSTQDNTFSTQDDTFQRRTIHFQRRAIRFQRRAIHFQRRRSEERRVGKECRSRWSP